MGVVCGVGTLFFGGTTRGTQYVELTGAALGFGAFPRHCSSRRELLEPEPTCASTVLEAPHLKQRGFVGQHAPMWR